MHSESRVLFILKRRLSHYGYDTASSGLFHSAFFCAQALRHAGARAKIVVVFDNNDIDREVTAFKPTDVIIEALWVVPEKFPVLIKLHPQVRWIVRLHSEIPFLAQEGIAMDWILHYLRIRHVFVSGNSIGLNRDLVELARTIHHQHKVLYLPNCYTDFPRVHRFPHLPGTIDIGCFGAIRPLKNQLLQAVAAIEFVRNRQQHERLRFHINANRVEWQGESVIRNLRGLFANLDPALYQLVEHPWMSRHDYLRVLVDMDLGMQCSLSETFNIATADMVSRDIPVVVSPEVPWVAPLFQAEATNSDAIVKAMRWAYGLGIIGTEWNKLRLRKFATESAQIWRGVFV
jgi:glycosyltransferase involved in cell wall biosynthesis